MARAETIAVYDSQSREYHQAFQVFLDHTDQKLKAQQWLSNLIDRMPSRRVFIDVGAGNGKVTAWFTERFGRTIPTLARGAVSGVPRCRTWHLPLAFAPACRIPSSTRTA